MSGLRPAANANVLAGLERLDDAGVYRLTDDLALVQTVDFFTPVVDDPELFGRIAAVNALSDCWAMGGRPVCAMNIVCFPAGEMDIEVLRRILAGGLETLREAEVALVGGHSVDGPELKYGLSVTGTVHPERFLRNTGARAGDRLVLTKPLGTGVIATAVKGGLAHEGQVPSRGSYRSWKDRSLAAATASMTTLNRRAAELMLDHGARACTDVTGFGLLGHACEMVSFDPEALDGQAGGATRNPTGMHRIHRMANDEHRVHPVHPCCTPGGVGLVIRAGSVPLLPGALSLARMGLLPAGLHRNRRFYAGRVGVGADVPEAVADVLHDPQTSGGLLIALAPEEAEGLLAGLRAGGCDPPAGGEHAAVIGEFVAENPGEVMVRA